MTVQQMEREGKKEENPSEICIGIEQPNLQERKKKNRRFQLFMKYSQCGARESQLLESQADTETF